MPSPDPGAFGRALAKLRQSRGYTQDEVALRIPTYYSNGGVYGRIERGLRRPDRDVALAILVQGLLVREIAEINRVIQLAGYEQLTPEEIQKLGLIPAQTVTEPPEVPVIPPDTQRDWRSGAILIGSLALAGLLALLIPGHGAFVLLTSALYAALYPASLYLESAFEPERFQTTHSAARAFGFIAVSSMSALAIDRILVDSGNMLALPVSMAIFLAAAIAQFLMVRPALAESSIVPATFQTHTAQSAHLKNTTYFFLIVALFWLPSFHCVLTLSREFRAGHADWVRLVAQSDLMLGRGLLALSVRWLLGLLLVEFLLSLYMRHVLLDQLRPHARLNSFTLWFYLRAFLNFLLCLLCIGWYAYSLSDFT